MWRRFFRLIAALLLWVACAAPALAQAQKQSDDDVGEVSVTNAPAYAVALLSSLLVMLIVWFENEFGVSTEVEELTIDNFGTIDLMLDYLHRHGGTTA